MEKESIERKLTLEDIPKLKVGQQILVDAFIKDQMHCLSFVYNRSNKYPITDSNGRKCYSKGRNEEGAIEFVYADEQGETGEETEMEFTFLSFNGASLMLKEKNFMKTVDSFNIRLINKHHEKYNSALSKKAKSFCDYMENSMKALGT